MKFDARAVTDFLRSRQRLLVFGAVSGVVLSLWRSDPLPYDVTALAAALGREAHAQVKPQDVRWEPSRGLVADALWGRRVLFLGVPTDPAEDGSLTRSRDLYRAEVRVSPEGRPIAVESIRNLTGTALGDDHSLVVRGDKAAIATAAFGQEQSVTWFDLSGEGAQNTTEALHDRAMAAITNWQQTGSTAGVGRVDVTFDDPVSAFTLTLSDTGLHVGARTANGELQAVLSHETREVIGERAHGQGARHLPKRLVFWAVDTVRAVPWIGPAPIAWLEERTFALRDKVRRATAKGDDQVVAQVEAPRLAGASGDEENPTWPPAPMKSIWKNPEPHEGEWMVPEVAHLKKLTPAPGTPAGKEPPSAFMRAFVRPDEERSYAKVLLVAMDMRQLDLDMEAGVEDPKPLTGPPGTGRIPRDPKVYRRVAAAFNGGFKTEHGNYGMMLRKRVLLPPVSGAASLIVLKDGRIGMGSWGATNKVTGLNGVRDEDIVSFRQNLDPLIENDVVNPSGRSLWGFTLPGTSMQTERSGVCVTREGNLLYAWGDDVSATTLGKAMKMAGCAYGMHLDMNPHHTGLIFTNINELKGKGGYKSELLTNKMEISPDRYIEYAPKDFFYVMMKEMGAPDGGAGEWTWQVDAGAQPPPTWAPAIYRASDAEAELTLVEPRRARMRLRAGTDEKGQAHELNDADKKHVLMAVTLGASSDRRTRALTVEGKAVTVKGNEEGTAFLSIDAEGLPTIGESPVEGATDVAELPLVLHKGEPGKGRHARAALCIREDGRMVLGVAKGTASLAAAMKKAKCETALGLERSTNAQAEYYRSGTTNAPRVHYAHTSLSFMSKALLPPAFVFTPTHPVEPPKKKK